MESMGTGPDFHISIDAKIFPLPFKQEAIPATRFRMKLRVEIIYASADPAFPCASHEILGIPGVDLPNLTSIPEPEALHLIAAAIRENAGFSLERLRWGPDGESAEGCARRVLEVARTAAFGDEERMWVPLTVTVRKTVALPPEEVKAKQAAVGPAMQRRRRLWISSMMRGLDMDTRLDVGREEGRRLAPNRFQFKRVSRRSEERMVAGLSDKMGKMKVGNAPSSSSL